MRPMPGRAVLIIVAVASALRLLLAHCIGPGNDEAYYALYLDHPDWSYFDHPPMVALVARLGRWLGGERASIASLRLGFVALFAASTLLVGQIARRAFGEGAEAPSALALNLSWYFGAAVGTFVLPDGPLLFFWLLAMDRLMVAIAPGRGTLPWIGVGLAWGGAMLSKYHAVLMPIAFVAFAAMEKEARRCLRSPGPYLALTIGLLLFAPVIAWNAQNGWVSFRFQGARATSGPRFDPPAMLGAMAAQAFYLMPWMAVGFVVVGLRAARRSSWRGDGRPWDRFFLAFAAVPIGVFGAVSLVKPVFPHWGLIGAVGMMPLLGEAWGARMADRPRSMRRRLAMFSAATVLVTALAVIQSRGGVLQAGGPGPLALIPAEADPTRDLVGWDQVAGVLRDRGLLDRPDTFVFTGHWHLSGQLSRAIGPGVPVLCYHEGDARGFASWSRPSEWVGRDGILVAVDDRSTEPHCFDRWFERIEPVARFAITRRGVPIRSVRIFLCHRQTRPFPFDHRPGTARTSTGTGAGASGEGMTLAME